MDWERALIWRQRIAAGCRFGLHWVGMLGGHRIVPVEQLNPPFWRECPPARLAFLSTYHLSPDNASHYHKYLSERGVDFLSGYPSALYALALSLRKNGLALPLKGVFYGAEPLHAFQRDAIEAVFGCYLWDYYGLTERVVSASEFECRNGLHINWENSFFEVLGPDGRDVRTGEAGELVGTSLSNTSFTILRYRTGDMTKLLEGECTCGRISPRITAIDTKVEDLLVMPDGSLLSASNLTFPFKGMSHIRQSQIYQKVPSELVIRIVPDLGFSDEDADKLRREVEEMLPRGVEVKIKCMASIPANSSGKFSFAVSEVDRSECLR
jgi:phenylacetate-CoA ligase